MKSSNDSFDAILSAVCEVMFKKERRAFRITGELVRPFGKIGG
jgi:hypothetical protein